MTNSFGLALIGPLSAVVSQRHARAPAVAPSPVFYFSVLVAAEPGVMPRVLELFAKRNLVPRLWAIDVSDNNCVSLPRRSEGAHG